MPYSSNPQTFLPSDATSVMPTPVSRALYPGLPSSSSSDEGTRAHHLPGVRCPTCAANGQEVWVIPGRACGNCGTPCC